MGEHYGSNTLSEESETSRYSRVCYLEPIILNFSESQFPQLANGVDKTTYFIRWSVGIMM